MPAQQTDTVEELQGALIQHGPLSDRVYLMKLGQAEPGPVAAAIRDLAIERRYTKIFAKLPAACAAPFLEAGFRKEAVIPGFFRKTDDAIFLAYYFSDERKNCPDEESIKKSLFIALSRGAAGTHLPALDQKLVLRACGRDDTEEMARLYATVFPSYPFPISDPSYLRETMDSHIRYYGIFEQGFPVALCSAECDTDAGAAEMSDFATREDYRGKGLASHLLRVMEPDIQKNGIRTSFTICRAVSTGINTVFIQNGYTYAGRLINNTNIGGQIESMNVWYKRLDQARS